MSFEGVAAVLLAAGRSRRMGAFKPLLPFGGVTVVESCVKTLQAAGAAETVVVVGHRAEDVRAALAGRGGLRFAVNEDATSEMGASIARGVEALSAATKAALVALVDHPAVPAAEVRKLVEAWVATGAPLVLPEWEGRGGHPVLVDMRLKEELLSLDARGGLRSLFAKHAGEVLRVPAGSPYVVRDMDTWGEYAALYRDVFGTEPPAAGGPA